MARHIHIYLPARVRDTAPAPAKHPPAAVSELVERLMQAIADRSGKKTTDAGFDESKVKRDAGGQFSAHGGSGQAAAKHHEEMAAKHHEAAKQDFAPRKDHERAAQLHQNAGKEAIMHLTHGTPYEHYSNAASIAAGKSAAMGLGGSAASPKGEINQVTGKPTSATAKGAKAGTHELLSSGHPFSMDELVKATGSSKASVMTALSDLKNPKYAGSKGALNIVKKADGSYHVQKAEGGERPATAGQTHPLMAAATKKLDAEIAANPRTLGGLSKEKAGSQVMSAAPKAASKVPSNADLAQSAHQAYVTAVSQGNTQMANHYKAQHEKYKAASSSKVDTSTPAGSSLLSSFLKNENAKAAPAHKIQAAKNKVGLAERALEKLKHQMAFEKMKGKVGRSDGRLFDARARVSRAQNELRALEDTQARIDAKKKPSATTSTVNTNTAAGHNLLSSFLKNENAKTSKGIPDGRTTLPTGHIAHMTTYPNGAKHVTLKHPDTTYLHRIQYGPDGKVRGHQIDTPTKIQTVRGPATGTKTKTLTPEESESMHNKLHRVIRDVPDKK